MRIVVALGGNALLERGETPDPRREHQRVRAAARALAPVSQQHELVLCHGNGPQIGLLANESQTDTTLDRPYPLDVIGAETQGMIGYCLAQELRSAAVGRDVVALVTQTVVDPHDPAFADPTKYIGRVMSDDDAAAARAAHGWEVRRDGGGWRRVVPSPAPREVVELPAVRLLLSAGAIVVCGGGGGVPVRSDGGRLTGIEAVVDKDATAGLLAVELGADLLVILTDVDAVKADFGLPTERPLGEIGADELRGLSFPAGSMGPKVAACLDFVSRTGRSAHIGSLHQVRGVVDGTAGTRIRPRSGRLPEPPEAARQRVGDRS